MQSNKNICVGIVAHVDAGKTTITEQFLYKAGVNKTIGRVDHKNATADNMKVEKERGITVRATTLSFPWKDKTIQLLDTPGHVDFIAEVERALSVLDAAVLAISAKEGIQTQTRIIFGALRRLNIPTVIFVNKVDRMGVDLESLYQDIHTNLTPKGLMMQKVMGEGSRDIGLIPMDQCPELIEKADDLLSGLCDNYLEKALSETAPIDMVYRTEAMKVAFNKGQVYPILHGSALHGIGMDELLSCLVANVEFTPKETLYGRCYKVDRDAHGNRRCFTRIYGGQIVLREDYPIVGEEHLLKIRNLAGLEVVTPIAKPVIEAGEIAVIYDHTLKVEDVIGEDLGRHKTAHIATPTLIAAVNYDHLGHRKEILSALDVLTDEDPFLDYRIHPVNDDIEVKLFGTVQKEILLDLMLERFGIKTTIDPPKTLYLEKPSLASEAVIRMYKDTQLPATVGLKVEPLKEGAGFEYTSRVSLGDLKKPFQTAVEDGVIRAVADGTGQWALTDLKVTFYESDYDSVNSTPSDYRKLAPQVLRKALEDVPMLTLEPYLSYVLEIPEYAIGRAVSDVLKMRGTVSDPSIVANQATLKGIIPVDTCKSYGQVLADYTGGKGVFHTEFHGYKERA